jgi:hypothetical protein
MDGFVNKKIWWVAQVRLFGARKGATVEKILCDAFHTGWNRVGGSGFESAHTITAAFKDRREWPALKTREIRNFRHLGEIDVFIPEVCQQLQFTLLLLR